MGFKVEKILTANTIVVYPAWRIGDTESPYVRILGFENMGKNTEGLVKKMLEVLILNKDIELKRFNSLISATPEELTIGINQQILLCAVYLDGVDISEYYHQLQSAS